MNIPYLVGRAGVTVQVRDVMQGDTLMTDAGPVFIAHAAVADGAVKLTAVSRNTERLITLGADLKVIVIRGKAHTQHMADLMAYARANPVPEVADIAGRQRADIDRCHAAELAWGEHA